MSDDKPTCKLIGEDGNVFSIMSAVSRALKRSGRATEAAEFSKKAMESDSYGAVLRLAAEYVEIT